MSYNQKVTLFYDSGRKIKLFYISDGSLLYKQDLNKNTLKDIKAIISQLGLSNLNKLTKKQDLINFLSPEYINFEEYCIQTPPQNISTGKTAIVTHLTTEEIGDILNSDKNIYCILKLDKKYLSKSIKILATNIRTEFSPFPNKSDKELILYFFYNKEFIQDLYVLNLKQQIILKKDKILDTFSDTETDFKKLFEWVISSFINNYSEFYDIFNLDDDDKTLLTKY